MKNPVRHAFFIQQLSRKLTEEQLCEIIKSAQDAVGYGNEPNPAPQLSAVQQGLCEWLAADGFREAADERLVAQRDLAWSERDDAKRSIYDANRNFEAVKQQASKIRLLGERIADQFTDINKTLESVPKPERRSW